MLSIENPSCSSSKPSDLAAHHDDHQPQLPNFSLRDYVFKSRSKDIRINWPFREQHLQLCLNNGISDVLPPLQLPSLVREHCIRKRVESEQLPKCTINTIHLENEDTVLGSTLALDSLVVNSDQSRHSLSVINVSSVTSHDMSEGILAEQLNKCRLSVKLGTGGETSTPEDLLSNLITVSDPMASKVCPVCKSFTSSSNTTLNAHIDRCLSSDQSNASRDVVTEFPKLRVKPSKKRLMVDIYATALHCTLEDLDRRNGTNWATMATVAPANDANLEIRRTNFAPSPTPDLEIRRTNFAPSPTPINFAPSPTPDDIDFETKRTKLLPSDTALEGNVGDIYVDSNGTKILILSKCDGSPPLVSRNNIKLKKHEKGLKEGSTMTKKKILTSKFSKVMKDNKGKLSLINWSKDEIEATTADDRAAEVPQEEEESVLQLLNAHDKVKSSEPSKLGHWVCSKRSDLSRKLNNKDISRGLEKMILLRKKPSFRRTQPDSSPSSIQKTRVLDLPCTSEAMASPKTRGMNIISNTGNGMESGKQISSLPSKLNSKLLLEGDSLADDRMTKISRPNESFHPSLKARRNLAFKKRRPCVSLEGLKVDKSERFITPKKFKKKRSILGCSKWKGEKYRHVNGGSDGSNEDFDLGSSRANETSKIHQSNFSENQEKTATPDYGTNMDSSPEEDVASISRDETQEESPAETSTYDQEVQCRDAISNEVVSQDNQIAGDQAEPMLKHGEFQTDTSSFQELSPCSASDGEMGLENALKNSSKTVARAKSNLDHNMIVDMESSGSAVSTSSAISPPSPMDDATKYSGVDRLAEYNPLQDKLSSPPITTKDNNMKLSAPAWEPSCSCSESLSRESQLSSHARKNKAPNLFIRPPDLPCIRTCSSLESHNESALTGDSSKSGMNVSTPCSGVQSSNPILRLMGKDLVVGKEESVQLPAILPCETNYPSQPKFISFLRPDNVGFISYSHPYHYQIHATGDHQISLQPIPGPYMLNSPYQHSMNMVAPPQHWPNPIIPSNQASEVIMIDDDSHGKEAELRTNTITSPQTVQNPNVMAPQRLYACIPPQNPYASRAFTSSRRETSEGSFMFPSPSSLYFSPTLR